MHQQPMETLWNEPETERNVPYVGGAINSINVLRMYTVRPHINQIDRRSRTPPLKPLCGWARVCKQRASYVESNNALGGKKRHSAQTASLHVVLASYYVFHLPPE